MPELPEIETVRRNVAPLAEGRRIVSVTADGSRILKNRTAESMRMLEGSTVTGIGRRGKALIVRHNSGIVTVIRFGMTGQLYVCPAGFPVEKHTHVTVSFDDETQMRFVDTRMFGAVWVFGKGEEDDCSGIGSMGPEPDDPSLTGDYLRRTLSKRSTPVQAALMDQSAVAGLGNIWSGEALFRAGICPLTPCSALSESDWDAVARSIRETVGFAIDKNTVTAEDYLEGKGRRYYDIGYLNVYGREGEPCVACGTPLIRSRICGRSAYWCPKCQPQKL
ncbi:MAG: bifunctional DNA-formamidopyrimidine glycosylase/DNA-(apurinic or apyrimidinic site) lyase [Candidatus Methanomethylophilus sp.]|jgi:formamidopyrimidine-DNA glycosylase|nr:bifunctional DNA-formamidopyrimidine glycosylase/DNA-(apurinic or apyrimidinic site) lyase [Methanomethylophilus sp.]MCI2093737.1 bifunctional DNA-formamidopyrimidine glycosylase/DNA-(apurinic or apyrimidinic site) lyase [Methanomethylophilus sp.]